MDWEEVLITICLDITAERQPCYHTSSGTILHKLIYFYEWTLICLIALLKAHLSPVLNMAKQTGIIRDLYAILQLKCDSI